MWKNINEVPKVFRQLEGVYLELEQVNLIYKELAIKYARKRKDGRTDPDYAKARTIFKSQYDKTTKGNKQIWTKKEDK